MKSNDRPSYNNEIKRDGDGEVTINLDMPWMLNDV